MHGKFYASMALATHDQSLSREASFQKKLLFIVPAAAREYMRSRVSQKNQKSKFWYATNPSGFHRLDEPPEKNSAL